MCFGCRYAYTVKFYLLFAHFPLMANNVFSHAFEVCMTYYNLMALFIFTNSLMMSKKSKVNRDNSSEMLHLGNIFTCEVQYISFDTVTVNMKLKGNVFTLSFLLLHCGNVDVFFL